MVPFCCQATENAEPPEDSDDGVAPAVEPPEPRLTSYEPFEPSAIGELLHAESEIVPLWPLAVAEALVKSTVPKSASASGWHSPVVASPPEHCDGAYAINSALEVSGLLIWRFLVVDCPVV